MYLFLSLVLGCTGLLMMALLALSGPGLLGSLALKAF